MIQDVKIKKGVDIGKHDITNVTMLRRKPQMIVEMEKLREKQESHMNFSENRGQHGRCEPGQCNVLVNEKPHESSKIEIEQAVKNKNESKCKGLLMEVKTHEEDMQQMDDQEISSKFFQLVVPLLKAWKRENQTYGVCALNNELIEKEHEFSTMIEEWTIVPKVIRRKRHIGEEMIKEVKTGLSAIKLCQGQNTICN